jgi:hypothetical protein
VNWCGEIDSGPEYKTREEEEEIHQDIVLNGAEQGTHHSTFWVPPFFLFFLFFIFYFSTSTRDPNFLGGWKRRAARAESMGFIPIQECIETKQLHQRGVSEQFREEMKNKAAWGWRRKEKRPSSSSMVNHRLAGREIIKTSFYSSSSSLLFSHRFFFFFIFSSF